MLIPLHLISSDLACLASWRSGQDIAVGAGGLGFNARAGKVGHSVANGSLPSEGFGYA